MTLAMASVTTNNISDDTSDDISDDISDGISNKQQNQQHSRDHISSRDSYLTLLSLSVHCTLTLVDPTLDTPSTTPSL